MRPGYPAADPASRADVRGAPSPDTIAGVSDTSISVTGTVDAPVERVFALLADPDRHPDLDASGMVRHSETHLAITELGDVFMMAMHNDL